MMEDYDCPKCFECGDECSTIDGLLVCDECTKTYTQEEWEQANEKELEAFIAFLKDKESEQ